MYCKVALTTERYNRYLKVLRADEPKVKEDEKPRTDTELIQDALFTHISGTVLYKERKKAESSVKEF